VPQGWGATLAASLAITVGASPVVLAAESGSPKDVTVAVVVDFGHRTGQRGDVVVRCLRVPVGTSGADVLVDVATAAHVAVPTYNASGLLCSIDGLPKSGCGAQVADGFAYWSYWHGGRSWSYANVGPTTWVVHQGDVEGWRFDDDSNGSSSDPAPRAPSSYVAACTASDDEPFPVTVQATGATTSTDVAAAAVGLVVLGIVVASVRRWRRHEP
jgi:hypothetical protein